MYNDLQDALGYRMDQNAPFNPSYSIANLPVASLPLPISPVPAMPKLRQLESSRICIRPR